MMRYLPHTDEEIAEMLQAIGTDTLDGLYNSCPTGCCTITDLDLPEALTEWELNRHMDELAGCMGTSPGYKVFLGAGSYDHFIPAVVQSMLSRSEFVTAYTPYQPEISQGTLQAIYEYQTLVAWLTGMDVANASMYDGASGLAEALLMSIRATRRKKVAVSTAIHPHYRQVVNTYFNPTGYGVVEIPYRKDGRTDISRIRNLDELAGVAVQSPNFFGCVEDLEALGNRIHSDPKALMVVAFSEPMAYGLLKNPGSLGADIVCGEGQSFGIPRSFGGPGLGLFAAKQKLVRNMPGRLVGQTVDTNGQPGFVLTLATREQHIRREKATSNICTNQGLCAMASTMYMATIGGTGLKELARLNYDKTEYLKGELTKAGFSLIFDSPTFNEFVVKFPDGFENTYQELFKKKIVAGLALENDYPELKGCYLLCVTETSTREDLDLLVREVIP